MLGLLTIIIVPVQLLLIAFAMRGFQQQWNVEVEVAPDRGEAGGPGGPRGGRVRPGRASAAASRIGERAVPASLRINDLHLAGQAAVSKLV